MPIYITEIQLRPREFLTITVFIAICVAILGRLAFGSPEQAVIHATGWGERKVETANCALSAQGTQPSVAVIMPDPRFARQQPTVVPDILSPEARQMAFTIQNKYRCAHCCDGGGTPQCLPGLGEDGSPDAKVLVAALKNSLGTLPDDCYVSTALPKVVDTKTPAELMNVLYEDLLKRPNPIKLRMLFIIAEIADHPLAASALAELRTTLNLDHQHDWPRWEQAVTQQCVHEERGMRSDNCRIH